MVGKTPIQPLGAEGQAPEEKEEEGKILHGFAKIKCENGKLKVYTQWSERDVDWSRGEDLVFTLEDVEEITETFKNTVVIDIDVDKDGITLWLKSKS